jgi:hypothetical protein
MKKIDQTINFSLPVVSLLIIIRSNYLSTINENNQKIWFLIICFALAFLCIFLSRQSANNSKKIRPNQYIIISLFYLSCGILSFFDPVVLLFVVPVFVLLIIVSMLQK